MADMITRCPQCATAFRVSEAHLKTAKGRVRCGSCLHIFVATDHLVKHLDESPAEKEKEKEKETPIPLPLKEPGSQADEDDDEVADDEAWALELLKDDSDLDIQLKKIVLHEGDDSRAAAEHPADPAKENLLNELDELLTSPRTKPPRAESKRAEAKRPAPKAAPAPEKARDSEAEAPTLEEIIASIEPDSLEVQWQQDGPGWRKRLLWTGSGLLALLLLTVLVAWLEFARLSRVEPYRSWYATACEHLGCELPELVDRSQIRTSNLLVRSHPELADTLLVDVILHNRAAFEQPFPELQLTFSNLRNQTIAVRRFRPEEYLGGELVDRRTMPVNTPIHIALEVEDPGAEAVSYSMAIVD